MISDSFKMINDSPLKIILCIVNVHCNKNTTESDICTSYPVSIRPEYILVVFHASQGSGDPGRGAQKWQISEHTVTPMYMA